MTFFKAIIKKCQMCKGRKTVAVLIEDKDKHVIHGFYTQCEICLIRIKHDEKPSSRISLYKTIEGYEVILHRRCRECDTRFDEELKSLPRKKKLNAEKILAHTKDYHEEKCSCCLVRDMFLNMPRTMNVITLPIYECN